MTSLKEAYNISSASTEALSQSMAAAELLLSRRKQERDRRIEGFKAIIQLMEAELEAAEVEIEGLEKMIFGEKKIEALPADPETPGYIDQEEADEEARLAFHEAKFPEAAE